MGFPGVALRGVNLTDFGKERSMALLRVTQPLSSSLGPHTSQSGHRSSPALKTQFSLSKKALSLFRRPEAGRLASMCLISWRDAYDSQHTNNKRSNEVFVKILLWSGRFSFLKCKQPLLRGGSTGVLEKVERR